MSYNPDALARSERVSKLGRKVREIRDRRGITASEIARECRLPYDGVSNTGRINALMNSYVIREHLEPLVVAWVELNS